VEKEIHSKVQFHKSITDRIALWITNVFGSMRFLTLCLALFTGWILWNLKFFHSLQPFDPYPFYMLTMIVSLFAIILSISVLINQNRERRLRNLRQQLEFEVNVRAEKEITKVLEMLHEIQIKLGMNAHPDNELKEMKENLDIQNLHDQLENSGKVKT